MSVYRDDDQSTVETLLDETVRYAEDILTALRHANIVSCAKWNPDVYSASVTCLSPNCADYIVNLYARESDDLVVRRLSYDASHPAIVDSFVKVIQHMMKDASFSCVEGKAYKDYQPNDFGYGISRGATSISCFGISCHALPEALETVLWVDRETLREYCTVALKESFSEMAAFNMQQKYRSSRTMDVQGYSADLD